jgi:hypothetical protein
MTEQDDWFSEDVSLRAPAALVAEAREFIRATTWTYAKTMADRPHWYVVANKETDNRIEALLTLLHRYGNVRRWHRLPFVTVDLNGHSYWQIERVINRKPTAFAGWDGDPVPPQDWLAGEYRRNLVGDEMVEPTERGRDWLAAVEAHRSGLLVESDHFGEDPDEDRQREERVRREREAQGLPTSATDPALADELLDIFREWR